MVRPFSAITMDGCVKPPEDRVNPMPKITEPTPVKSIPTVDSTVLPPFRERAHRPPPASHEIAALFSVPFKLTPADCTRLVHAQNDRAALFVLRSSVDGAVCMMLSVMPIIPESLATFIVCLQRTTNVLLEIPPGNSAVRLLCVRMSLDLTTDALGDVLGTQLDTTEPALISLYCTVPENEAIRTPALGVNVKLVLEGYAPDPLIVAIDAPVSVITPVP